MKLKTDDQALYREFGQAKYVAVDKHGAGIVAGNTLRVVLLRARESNWTRILEWHRDEFLAVDPNEIDYVAKQLEDEGYVIWK